MSRKRPIDHVCDHLLRSRKCQAAVRAIMKDHNHPHFVAMWKACANIAYGKPSGAFEHHDAYVIHVEQRTLP
jgi:hypothetical protein